MYDVFLELVGENQWRKETGAVFGLVSSWHQLKHGSGDRGSQHQNRCQGKQGIEDLIKLEILRQWGFPRLSRSAPDVTIRVQKRQKGIWYSQLRTYCEHGSKDWSKMTIDKDVRVCQNHLHELVCGNILILKFWLPELWESKLLFYYYSFIIIDILIQPKESNGTLKKQIWQSGLLKLLYSCEWDVIFHNI